VNTQHTVIAAVAFVAGLENIQTTDTLKKPEPITQEDETTVFQQGLVPSQPKFCKKMTITELKKSGVYDKVFDLRKSLKPQKIVGTSGNDLYIASTAGGSFNGGQGNDCVIGSSGPDILDGGAGVDTIWGQGGNDKINGNRGNDLLFGGAGNDVLTGGIGKDTVRGGGGTDTCNLDSDDVESLTCENIEGLEDLDLSSMGPPPIQVYPDPELSLSRNYVNMYDILTITVDDPKWDKDFQRIDRVMINAVDYPGETSTYTLWETTPSSGIFKISLPALYFGTSTTIGTSTINYPEVGEPIASETFSMTTSQRVNRASTGSISLEFGLNGYTINDVVEIEVKNRELEGADKVEVQISSDSQEMQTWLFENIYYNPNYHNPSQDRSYTFDLTVDAAILGQPGDNIYVSYVYEVTTEASSSDPTQDFETWMEQEATLNDCISRGGDVEVEGGFTCTLTETLASLTIQTGISTDHSASIPDDMLILINSNNNPIYYASVTETVSAFLKDGYSNKDPLKNDVVIIYVDEKPVKLIEIDSDADMSKSEFAHYRMDL